jgi:hypothetical protein
MYKIKIEPSIKADRLNFYLEKIKMQKLVGCPCSNHNGKYTLLNNVSHDVLDIIEIDNEMWALLEFKNTKLGKSIQIIVDSVGQERLVCKEFFLNKDYLSLNINI